MPGTSPVRYLVVFSDTHIGCQFGLLGPDGAAVDGGGHYQPSALQLQVWKHWRYFWDTFVPLHTKGQPFAICCNGDALDGVHHNSTTQWSQNLGDQRNAALDIFAPLKKLCRGQLYWIRGTEAHTGIAGVEEETLARELGALPNKTGQCARYELFKRMGPHVVHLSHHIGTTSSASHETSAINAELAMMFTDSGRWGHTMPAVVVRSHRHRHAEIRMAAKHGFSIACVTPAFQLKTPFVYRLAQGRTGFPQLGGTIICVDKSGWIDTRHYVQDLVTEVPE